MSDAYAESRFQEAVEAFRSLEDRLRDHAAKVDPKRVDAVLIDLDAAIPGLTDEGRGRALVFKAYVLRWRYLMDLGRRRFFDVTAPIDPRLVQALASARQGRPLLQTPSDRSWADGLVKDLEEYERPG